MCWSAEASIAFTGIGAVATGLAMRRGEPTAIWATIAYFTAMEALQVAGYAVINECGTTANRTVTWLSFLHIAIQPFFINAFAMELVPAPVKRRVKRWVYGLCTLSLAVMLVQLVPIEQVGPCTPGSALCAEAVCTRTGTWHQAWDVPYNGMLSGLESLIGFAPGFPTYLLVAFVMPLIYGAWRLVLFHALAGPVFALTLTDDPNEMPAIWCLFSIGIILVALSPLVRQRFTANSWWGRPAG